LTYVETTFNIFGMENSKTMSTPMMENNYPEYENITECEKSFPYRQLVGSKFL